MGINEKKPKVPRILRRKKKMVNFGICVRNKYSPLNVVKKLLSLGRKKIINDKSKYLKNDVVIEMLLKKASITEIM